MEKKKLGWIAGTIAGISLAVAGVAGAQGVAPQGPKGDRGAKRAELIKKYDANKDGKLDGKERQAAFEAMRAEHQAEHAAKVKQFDKNADGKLDETERQAMYEARMLEHFSRLDTNKNGSVDITEFKAGHKEHQGRGFGPGMHRGKRDAFKQFKKMGKGPGGKGFNRAKAK